MVLYRIKPIFFFCLNNRKLDFSVHNLLVLENGLSPLYKPIKGVRTTFFVCKTRAKRSVALGSERSERTSVDDTCFCYRQKSLGSSHRRESPLTDASPLSLRWTKSIIQAHQRRPNYVLRMSRDNNTNKKNHQTMVLFVWLPLTDSGEMKCSPA